MNSRIRFRGYSAKEIAFQRDQITNQVRPVSDEEMATKQYDQRKRQHPKTFSRSDHNFHIGDNVYLKRDASKLKGREMFKVTEMFSENGESWVTVQKAENQFRNNEYKDPITVPPYFILNE